MFTRRSVLNLTPEVATLLLRRRPNGPAPTAPAAPLLRRKEQELFPNMDLETGLIMEQPIGPVQIGDGQGIQLGGEEYPLLEGPPFPRRPFSTPPFVPGTTPLEPGVIPRPVRTPDAPPVITEPDPQQELQDDAAQRIIGGIGPAPLLRRSTPPFVPGSTPLGGPLPRGGAAETSPGVTFSGSGRYSVDAGLTPDDATAEGVAPYSGAVDELKKPVGSLKASLRGPVLGNYVTAAMRRAAGDSPVDFAITNQSSFRSGGLPAGAVSANDVYNLLPFDDSLVVVDVKGADLQSFLGRNGGSMAVSGNTQALDPDKTYSVVTNDYLIKRGGPRSLPNAANPRPLGVTVRDAVINSVKSDQGGMQALSRRPAQVDAQGVTQQTSQTQSASPVQDASASTSARPSLIDRMEANQQKLLDAFDKRLELERKIAAGEIKDENGKLRSFLINAGLSALRGLAAGGIGGAIGGAITGGIYGAVRPQADEEEKARGEMARLQSTIEAGLKMNASIADIERAKAQIEAFRMKNSPEAIAVKTGAAEMRELRQRLQVMGGTYRQGQDARADELVAKLGVSPKTGGGGLKSQFLKVAGGNIVYIDPYTGKEAVLYSAGMSEADRMRNAIAIEQLNLSRARLGLPPIAAVEDLEAASAPAVSQPSTVPVTQPAAQPATAPAPGAPVSPLLAPVPGAKAPVLPRGGYRRGGGSGGSSKGDQINNNILMREQGEINDINARAAAARERGDMRTAAELDRAAVERSRTLQRNPNFRGKVKVTYDSLEDAAQRNPRVEIKQAHPVLTRGDVMELAAQYGTTPDVIIKQARRKGISLGGVVKH